VTESQIYLFPGAWQSVLLCADARGAFAPDHFTVALGRLHTHHNALSAKTPDELVHLRVTRGPLLAVPTPARGSALAEMTVLFWWGGVHWRSAVPFDALRFPATS